MCKDPRMWLAAVSLAALVGAAGDPAAARGPAEQTRTACQQDARNYAHPACFSAQERAALGALHVESPDVQELFFIVLSLTEAARRQPGLVRTDGPYSALVARRFERFRGHPAVARLDALMATDVSAHMEPKLNSGAYRFDAKGRIVKRPNYTWIRGEVDNFAPLVSIFYSFAKDSRFIEFLSEPAVVSARREAIKYYENRESFADMRDWLARQFPSTPPYDTTAIWVSPLTGGWQHQDVVADGNFKQLILNVNYSGALSPAADLSTEAQAFRGQIILFTELNHGSLNPAVEAHRTRIDAALAGKLDLFLDRSKGPTSYDEPVLVVAEYLNFALVTLYACDRFPASDCSGIARRVERAMANRVFPRFAGFQTWLLETYRNRSAEQTVESLLPQVVNWFAAQAQLEVM